MSASVKNDSTRVGHLPSMNSRPPFHSREKRRENLGRRQAAEQSKAKKTNSKDALQALVN